MCICVIVCLSMMYNLIHNAGSCAMSVLIMDDTWPTLFMIIVIVMIMKMIVDLKYGSGTNDYAHYRQY